MKRTVLFLLTILLANDIIGQNKIQDTFWGCVLGKSTRNHVSSYMRNFSSYAMIGSYSSDFTIQKVKLGGFIFDFASFAFVNDTLCEINLYTPFSSKNNAINMRNNINSNLAKKYKLNSTFSEDGFTGYRYEDQYNGCIVYVAHKQSEGGKYFYYTCLEYWNFDLYKKQEDEL